MHYSRTLGILLVLLALALFGISSYLGHLPGVPLVYSNREMLQALWRAYTASYVEAGTFRTIDAQKENITTSEGQSYTMLRAVWIDDRALFDSAWKWTRANLERSDDHLFSWLYGKKPDGSFGILTSQGGNNSASDADTDIALSLLMAYARWGDQKYLDAAKPIIADIWNYEVIDIAGKPYLAANNVERYSSSTMLINPSYFAPYAYRIFAKVDPTHNWMGVVDTSYGILEKSSKARLDKQTSAGLPPDWVLLDKVGGTLLPAPSGGLSSNYGFDAMRVPWRLALDWQWYHDERAKAALERFSFLRAEWEGKNLIHTSYTHDGVAVFAGESAAFYGGAIGYFMATDAKLAKEVYEKKLKFLYNPDSNEWRSPLSYYDDNWAWFGIALYTGSLPNIAAQL